jgi:hypothetical protein
MKELIRGSIGMYIDVLHSIVALPSLLGMRSNIASLLSLASSQGVEEIVFADEWMLGLLRQDTEAFNRYQLSHC